MSKNKKLKPKITYARGQWRCAYYDSVGFGKSPLKAYESMWLNRRPIIGPNFRHGSSGVRCG